MPKLKKEADKKTAVKKPRAKRVIKKEKPLPKAKPITIDVIADDEDILTRHPAEALPADNIEERENLDVQKKFFSDLVAEMKDKKHSPNLSAPLPDNKDLPSRGRKSLHLYRRIAFQFIALTAIFLVIVAYFFLPSLKISLHPSAEAVSDSMSFNIVPSLDDQAPAVANSRSLVGHIQNVPLSAEKIYEASGEEILGEEVSGEVTLHNEYSKAQPLVANTRLLSPDNKLFRLKEAVNIPAGGTVKAQIYADKVSPEMAIGPTRFTIPGLWLGLQDQIYASSDEAFEYSHKIKRYVKQRDLDQAINDIKSTLAAKVDNSITAFYNDGEALAYSLDDSSAKIDLGAKLGEEVAEFNVAAANNLTLVSFSKEQAETLVKAKLAFLLPDDKKLSAFDGKDIAYRLDAFDADKGTATVTASFKGSMSLRTDANIIDRRQLVNLNQAQIADYLHSFPEIESYELKFFPAFIKRAPSLADRIKVSVD
ncbi:MAG: hypothetical protein PHG95_02620 [Patescibacteria group bacterium]|nr:hypothetical protein [Patescibacteria group bacterium]